MSSDETVRFAKKYLEDILSFFGINVDVATTISDNVIELRIPSTDLNAFLIGSRGDTLRSLQYIVSTTLKNKNTELYRINIDVADYKVKRADKLVKDIQTTVQKVIETGDSAELEPMNAADRRVVHQAVAEYPELTTESAGEGRDRHIVIKKR